MAGCPYCGGYDSCASNCSEMRQSLIDETGYDPYDRSDPKHPENKEFLNGNLSQKVV